MSSSSLSSAVIALEICNIILLSLLMATPAPKHAMVKSLMVACLLRSVLDVLPPIVQKARPADFSVHNLNAQTTTLVSFCVSDSILYISPTGHPTYSKVPHDAETPTITSPPSFFGQIIQRPTSMKILRNSQYLDRRFQAASDTGGLSPPPRPPLPRTHTVEEPPPSKASHFRLPFVHNPSLSAFGSQPSMHSQPNSSSMGDFSGEDDGILATTTVSHERIPWEGPRSDTPMSTRTFGRTTTSRR
ncbi:hypothetical protein TRAPUB_4473 [Trametes pubescens]|uniref:Uncharacterized protein n=1 Tax=Trametes pubescens TaxID=154538 RepID=A0A1M2VAS2_TRAPU|nr:hypothetical protein TRAPUB_4473 [Trametes pubescens]